MNYYRRYIGDYQRDTPHLSLAEHGAYTVILDAYYANGGKVPIDRGDLWRLCRAFEDYERKAVDRIADEFFPVNGDGARHNKRADKELAIAAPAIEAMRSAGRQGAAKRWGSDRAPYRVGNGVSDGVAIEPPTTNHQPPAVNLNPVPAGTKPPKKVKNNTHSASAFIRPDECSEKHWDDWLLTRKQKRLPNTDSAWRGFLREAEAAKITPSSAVTMCAERGWGGFRASFLDAKAGRKATLQENNQAALDQWLADQAKGDEIGIN